MITESKAKKRFYMYVANFFLLRSSTQKLRLYVFTSFRLYIFTSLRLSLREFKKSLPNIFIYESILIKIYVNANIMNK